MKSLIVSLALLCCAYAGSAKTAIPGSVVESDLTAPTGCCCPPATNNTPKVNFVTTPELVVPIQEVAIMPNRTTPDLSKSALIALCVSLALGVGGCVRLKNKKFVL